MKPDIRRAAARAAMALTAAIALSAAPAMAQEDDTFKLGVVSFLSGVAAQSFGVPAWDAGRLLIEKLNAGEVPAPYDTPGFGGMKIETVVIDEAGGANVQVQEFRNLVQRAGVDAVIGYISSGDCLAVAPVAEELKQFTILFDCGTPRIFEQNDYDYVFRTAAHATQDNVGLVRYLKAKGVEIDTFAGINQNYAWGQDSWADFTAAMAQIYPDAEVVAELFPAFGAGQYGTEISALMQSDPDLVYSSLWGGDLQAFTLQALPRGMFQQAQVVYSAGDHILPHIGNKMPEGVIIGARGAYGYMAPDTDLAEWWWDTYTGEYDVFPVQAAYRLPQGILGLKTAIETAMASNGGKKPTDEEMAAAMEGQSWETPGGKIEMAIGNGHQAIQPIGFGTTMKNEEGDIILGDVIRFPARCVNPPPDMTGQEWIDAGFPGAEC